LAVASKIEDILQVVTDVGGLHATNPTTPYLSLWARCRDFEKKHLADELYVNRRLGKVRCVRKTIHILTRDMMPVAYGATKSVVERASRRYMAFRGVSPKDYEDVSAGILDMLKGREMTASAIKKALSTQLDVSAILYLMCDRGLLVRGEPEKGWKDRRHRYALFSEYFPDVDLGQMDEAEAIRQLVQQYLRAFGPVSENDIVWWTGLGKRKVRAALNRLQEQIVRLSISGIEEDFILLRSESSLLGRTGPRRESTVNLLPCLDPYLMGYKVRDRYPDRRYYDSVFDRSGNATSAILLDGRVVGVWDFEQDSAPVVKLFLFDGVEGDVLKNVCVEAWRVGQFMADERVQIKECDAMVPLTERPAGSFMSPLKGC
jgi:hypothetical protein